MKTSNTPKVISPLTIENASKVSTVINLNNPEGGYKKFSYNEQKLTGNNYASVVGSGSNSSVLSEGEYKFWGVVSFK